MSAAPRQHRTYDPSVRELVALGRTDVVRRLRIPRSTAAGWKSAPARPLVLATPADSLELQAKVVKLEQRNKILVAVIVLLLALVRIGKGRLGNVRVPDADDKKRLLRAVDRAQAALPKQTALKVLGLSASRYGEWRRSAAGDCPLDDLSRCPKNHPTQLTPEEVRVMHEMATAPEYRHVPTSTLAILAQRLEKVFASASTWRKYVRERGWRRPRHRVHPPAPAEGIRADKPDGLWHIDTTVIRLLDNSKVYLKAVIDNHSRRVLAWSVGTKLEPLQNVALLVKAFEARVATAVGTAQSLMVDGGVENFNKAIDKLVNKGLLKRILALTDVKESNSMIERFWLAAKHNWLFLNSLDSLAAVRRLVDFYVTEYNSVLPHSALAGRTPDEVYFGKATDTADKLAAARAKARAERVEANGARACESCAAQFLAIAANDE